MPEIVISTENLHKFYGSRDQKVHALRGLDISIEEGEIVGIMGPSGCGKTTPVSYTHLTLPTTPYV